MTAKPDLLTLVDDLGAARRFARGLYMAVLGLASMEGSLPTKSTVAGVVELASEHHERLDALYEMAEALHDASKPGASS